MRVLWHVYRRGLDWFQQSQSFGLGYPCGLVLFMLGRMRGWTQQTALLQFIMYNEEVLIGSDSFIVIPNETNGLEAPSFFASTST